LLGLGHPAVFAQAPTTNQPWAYLLLHNRRMMPGLSARISGTRLSHIGQPSLAQRHLVDFQRPKAIGKRDADLRDLRLRGRAQREGECKTEQQPEFGERHGWRYCAYRPPVPELRPQAPLWQPSREQNFRAYEGRPFTTPPERANRKAVC